MATVCVLAPFSARASTSLFVFDSEGWIPSESFEAKKLSGEENKTPVAEKSPTTAEKAAPIENTLMFPFSRAPLFPSLNKGYDVIVDTTGDREEDPKASASLSDILVEDGFSENKWKTVSAQDDFAALRKSVEDEDDIRPLRVRKTYLPLLGIVPTPTPDGPSFKTAGHDYFRKIRADLRKQELANKKNEESFAQAALDAYKKQQLDALQSDKETLKALQAAIKALGLTNQLNFIAERGSVLSATDGKTTLRSSAPEGTALP